MRLGRTSGSSKLLRLTDQLRQRIGAHFLHYLSPMDIDGLFADPEFRRGLLVKQSSYDQLHDLAFTRGQRGKSQFQLDHIRPLPAVRTVAFSRLFDSI